MTPTRYTECLRHLRCSNRGMAIYLRINTRVGRRYLTGQMLIPETLEDWLEMLVAAPDWRAALAEHPYPDDWKAVKGPEFWEEVDDDEAGDEC